MIEENVNFYSHGYKLDASFYWPDFSIVNENTPIFIICSGFTGLKHIHPERFARFFTKLGYACFSFDYRGFHKSEGKKKWVSIEDQVSDIVHAVSFVSSNSKTMDRPIILMGWGMAGGLILEATRISPPVKALIALNGFYDAQRVQKTLRGAKKWHEFRQWLNWQRATIASTGEMSDIDPFLIYPLDPVSEQYVNTVLRKTPGYNESAMVALNFADSLLQFAPEKRLDHLVGTPILIAHGDKNALHPVSEAQSLFDVYPGPKNLYWIPDAGHTEWMLDYKQTFVDLIAEIYEWVKSFKY